MKEKYVVFIDQIGRHIIGTVVGETESTLDIFNPVILSINLDPQSGRLNVQTFPLIFFEFLKKEERSKNTWTYNKNLITVSNIVLNDDLIRQYEQINTPPVEENKPKVISIKDI